MTLKPSRILWPTDFSELSLCGGKYARGFVETFNAELHMIHVVPPPISPDVTVMMPAEMPVTLNDPELLTSCRQGLERLQAEHFANVDAVRLEAFYGNPWSGICEYAEKHEIDLIIVATHGRTGLRHVLIGSTAERIVQHAPCPVLVVKGEGRDFCA